MRRAACTSARRTVQHCEQVPADVICDNKCQCNQGEQPLSGHDRSIQPWRRMQGAGGLCTCVTATFALRDIGWPRDLSASYHRPEPPHPPDTHRQACSIEVDCNYYLLKHAAQVLYLLLKTRTNTEESWSSRRESNRNVCDDSCYSVKVTR